LRKSFFHHHTASQYSNINNLPTIPALPNSSVLLNKLKSENMVSFTTAATVSLFAVATMIQPSIQGAALRIGADVLGGVLGGGGGDSSSSNKRSAPAVSTANIPTFNQCLTDVHSAGTRLFLHKVDKTAMLTPVPQSCIDAANEYNALPNIADLEKTEGKIEVVGTNTLKLSGVAGQVQQLLEQSGTVTGHKGAASKTASHHPKGTASHHPKGTAKPQGQ
jgi:hypothetical protein